MNDFCIFIVILIYNWKKATLACLACLERLAFDCKPVLVVGDEAADATVEAIKKRFASAIVKHDRLHVFDMLFSMRMKINMPCKLLGFK